LTTELLPEFSGQWLLNTGDEGSRVDWFIPHQESAICPNPDHATACQFDAFDGASERGRRERDGAGHLRAFRVKD
jgi:hypothetical protein